MAEQSEGADGLASMEMEEDVLDNSERRDDRTPPSKQRIVKVLAPAVRLWLKTQVDSIEDLQLDIQSGDRALLSGKIDRVSLQAQGVVYQGLRLSFVAVTAQNIQVNLGQILRGKPLKLLAPIPVQGAARIHASDLNASMEADLLANALTQFLTQFLRVGLAASGQSPFQFLSPQIQIGTGEVSVLGLLVDGTETQQKIGIQTQVGLANPNTLQFQNLSWLPDVPLCDRNPEVWDDFQIDLGQDVAFEEVSITSGAIHCRVGLTIQP